MKYALYICLSILILSSCKKYTEDDKIFWMKTAMRRISSHSWKVEKFTIDGEDSTERVYYVQNSSYSFSQISMDFKKEKYRKGEPNELYRQFVVLPTSVGGHSGWDFTSGKNRLVYFTYYFNPEINPLRTNKKIQEWDILCLSTDRLKLKSVESNRSLILILKAI